MNRIDEMTNAFMKFFDEYAQKQQVSCGGTCASRHGIGERSSEPLTAHTGEETQASQTAGIHLVPEPPAIPEEPEWSDSDTARQMYDNITGRS